MFYSKWLLKRSPVRVGATISEIDTPTQTPKDMVFSQTSVKTQSLLKVVEIDRLKPEKSQQVNGSNGVVTDGHTESLLPAPMPATSFCEVYLKPEPIFDSKMFHDSDCEFFQDLVQWCSDPAKEELVQTTDSLKKNEENLLNTDTLHTPFSPQGWDVLDVNSPAPAGYYTATTPNDPLSPNQDGFTQLNPKFMYSNIEHDKKLQLQEQIWDITNLPVVLGDLTPEKTVDLNPVHIPEPVDYFNTQNTEYTTSLNTYNKMIFMDQDDSLDMKLDSVIPREVENNNVFISEYILNDDRGKLRVLEEEARVDRPGPGLSLDVTALAPWHTNTISTPEVLSYVEQLEKEKCTTPSVKTTMATTTTPWPQQSTGFVSTDSCTQMQTTPIPDYEPITPKSESHLESDVDDAKSHTSRRRRHDSEESDETYTPYVEYTPRKYKRRKPNIPIKDMIIALEGSQQLTKARRGRPPKRRESTVSSVCSVDDNTSSVSTHENKYRELRDKNNEASKRSRMNRKLKELQMEQLADELEERNKKLKVRADILEDMTKRLKDALMTAILQK